MSTRLVDRFDRSFSYLRLSLTDLCNFQCGYCLPEGCPKSAQNFLSLDEIRRLITAFAELGVKKIRLTGGEPSTRKDFLEIAHCVGAIPGIETLALTTNGFYLEKDVAAYYEAGIRSLNVSVDSLQPEVFAKITGKDAFYRVMAGVEAALKLPFKVKLNAVLLKDLNHSEFPDFLNFVKDRPISVRFIELMQTGDNQDYFKVHHLSPAGFQEQLLKAGWVLTNAAHHQDDGHFLPTTNGPAIEYSHPNYQGRIGFIAPYSKDFCASCNRLRLSARGELYLCLFTDLHYALRPLLQADSQKTALQHKIQELLHLKKASHDLHQGNTGKTSDLAKIGG